MNRSDFHHRLPGYAPTPLVAAPALASELGLEQLWLKDERDRFGLPAFKALGASWSAYGLLDARVGGFAPWATLTDLRAQTAAQPATTFVTATAGNHGRAVAWIARQFGVAARIYVPIATPEPVVAAIRDEGADVVRCDGDYDAAVVAAASDVGAHDILVADTSSDPDDLGAARVIDGYITMFEEIDAALTRAPDWVAVPVGVGGLAAAACAHYRTASVLGVEAHGAACVAASLRAGRLVAVDVAPDCTMYPIACGVPSIVAWPHLQRLAAVATIDDAEADAALAALRTIGVTTTRTGAAALAGLAKATPTGVAVAVVTEAAPVTA